MNRNKFLTFGTFFLITITIHIIDRNINFYLFGYQGLYALDLQQFNKNHFSSSEEEKSEK